MVHAHWLITMQVATLLALEGSTYWKAPSDSISVPPFWLPLRHLVFVSSEIDGVVHSKSCRRARQWCHIDG